jgi:HSP20 family molecular chaperone IbpA
VSFLKRLFGTADASKMPAGWASPTTHDDGDAIVLEMPAPGLDPGTLTVEPRGAKLRISARGESAEGRQKVGLDETINFPEGSDLSAAMVDYAGDRLVIRIPKSGLKQG